MTIPAPVEDRLATATTRTLFGLLIAAVLATSGITFNSLYLAIPAFSRHQGAAIDACELREPVAVLPAERGNELSWKVESRQRFNACVAPTHWEQIAFVLYGLVLLLGLAVVLYWFHPRILIRRGQMTVLTEEDDPDLAGHLTGLARRAGVRRPTFVVAPRCTVNGRAFG